MNKLQAFWEKKLEQSGLIDIEKPIGKERYLRQNSFSLFCENDLRLRAKAKYFDLLCEKVAHYKFNNPIEEFIICKTADGFKIAEIVRLLEEIGQTKHRHTVRFIIRRYEHKWGIRKWTMKQRNLAPRR